jgi:hypothetical protein
VKGQVAVAFTGNGNGQEAREKKRDDDFELRTVVILAHQDLITSKTM